MMPLQRLLITCTLCFQPSSASCFRVQENVGQGPSMQWEQMMDITRLILPTTRNLLSREKRAQPSTFPQPARWLPVRASMWRPARCAQKHHVRHTLCLDGKWLPPLT